MKWSVVISIVIAALFLASCSHTNNLHKYNLSSQEIFFEEVVVASVTNVEIRHKKTPSTGNESIDIIKDVATDIAGAVLAAETEEKLQKAADPTTIVKSVSAGVESGLVKYLKVRPTDVLESNTDFIVTTVLEDCKLVSYPNGMYISIAAMTSITYRNTGALVWEYDERRSAPIRYSPKKSYGDVATVIQAAELAMLTEEQIQEAVMAAANEVGYEISEVLREDIAELSE